MTEQTSRKLASIQRIAEVKPIEGADKICAYRVNNWWCVDQISKYNVGDLVVYCEVDSFIPNEIAPFLTKVGKEPSEYQGVKGERLRTIRLKKQIAQGLLLPYDALAIEYEGNIGTPDLDEGEDVTELLGIIKWEPPAEYMSPDAKGLFPSFFPKTDQERIQNCYKDMQPAMKECSWEVTEKVEGQSFSCYYNNGEFGVCSRNLELKDADNTFWNTARKYKLQEKLKLLGKNIVIQAEQVGPGIQGNIYGLSDYELFVFDIYDIDKQAYFSPLERQELLKFNGLKSAPTLYNYYTFHTETCQDILDQVDGKSVIGKTGTLREGLVFKANTKERISFKAVSNLYLLKQK